MRVVGITYTAEDGVQQTTLLVRSSVCLLHSSVRHVIARFFTQQIPLLDIFGETPVALRLQTDSDPFRHLRKRNRPAFDGKGITLERTAHQGGVIRIDHGFTVSIEQFELLCPGFFYGTGNYPNLNLLLSQRLFEQHVVCPSELWNIIRDRLLCEQFNEKQEMDGDFKQKLNKKYLTTQLQDYRPKIEELQERIEATTRHDRIMHTLEQIKITVHKKQMQEYTYGIRRQKELLTRTTEEKQELAAALMAKEFEMITEATRDIGRQRKNVIKNVLHSMVDTFEAELSLLREQHGVKQSHENSLRESQKLLTDILEIQGHISQLTMDQSKMDETRCSIENNQTLLMLSKCSDAKEIKKYVSDLQTLKASLEKNNQAAQEQTRKAEAVKRSFVDKLEKLKEDLMENEQNSTEIDDALVRLQKNVADIADAVLEVASLEEKLVNQEQRIWQEFLQLSSVSFTEVVFIASVKCALETVEPSLEDEFQGFVYDRALDMGIEADWLRGISCTAIFQSTHAALQVMELIRREYNIKHFHYIVLEKALRSTLQQYIRVNMQLRQETSLNYRDLVGVVDKVVKLVMEKFHSSRKLGEKMESLESFFKHHEELLEELNLRRVEHSGQLSSDLLARGYRDIVKVIECYTASVNYGNRQKARYDALLELIRQLNNVPLPTVNELEENKRRLNEQLKNDLQEATGNRQSYYQHLKSLSVACDALDFELDHYASNRPMMDGVPFTIDRKLDECFEMCCQSIRQALAAIGNEMDEATGGCSEETTMAVEKLQKNIQSLGLREHSIASRVTSLEDVLEDYRRENSFWTDATQDRVSKVYQNRPSDALLDEIARTQQQLREMHPGLKPDQQIRVKKKLKILQELEKQRLSTRVMCLNNIVLPCIDKLHVLKLRQVCQLVAIVSENLPELGGIVKVWFSYNTIDPDDEDANGDDEASFDLHKISSIKVRIIEENGSEIKPLSRYQLHMAHLILYMSFLYTDGCKLFLIDRSFQNLFDGGIVSMFDVLETHFPTMQIIVLGANGP